MTAESAYKNEHNRLCSQAKENLKLAPQYRKHTMLRFLSYCLLIKCTQTNSITCPISRYFNFCKAYTIMAAERTENRARWVVSNLLPNYRLYTVEVMTFVSGSFRTGIFHQSHHKIKPGYYYHYQNYIQSLQKPLNKHFAHGQFAYSDKNW